MGKGKHSIWPALQNRFPTFFLRLKGTVREKKWKRFWWNLAGRHAGAAPPVSLIQLWLAARPAQRILVSNNRATGFPHSTSADGPAGPTNPGLKQSLNRFPHATSVDGRPARIIFGKSNRANFERVGCAATGFERIGRAAERIISAAERHDSEGARRDWRRRRRGAGMSASKRVCFGVAAIVRPRTPLRNDRPPLTVSVDPTL